MPSHAVKPRRFFLFGSIVLKLLFFKKTILRKQTYKRNNSFFSGHRISKWFLQSALHTVLIFYTSATATAHKNFSRSVGLKLFFPFKTFLNGFLDYCLLAHCTRRLKGQLCQYLMSKRILCTYIKNTYFNFFTLVLVRNTYRLMFA